MASLHVESIRGSLAESVHRISAAVVDADGKLVAHSGEPTLRTFLRSAAKPFQAMPLVVDGVLEHYRISDEELALCCASHNSEAYQVAKVRALLARIGCQESDLACGPHRALLRDLALPDTEPAGPEHAEVPPSPIASNCSGKHTGMLALARHHGWEVHEYHLRTHAVQQRCKRELAHWSGLAEGDLGEATDGCGVVCFALPLTNMARAFARLAGTTEKPEGAIVRAMTTHPDLVAGRGRPCTAIMRAYPGKVLAKVGAEGVYGATLLDRGLGIALKAEDGHTWAAVVALLAVLDALDLIPSPQDALPAFGRILTRNTRGETVGYLRAAGSLTFD